MYVLRMAGVHVLGWDTSCLLRLVPVQESSGRLRSLLPTLLLPSSGLIHALCVFFTFTLTYDHAIIVHVTQPL